VPPLHAEDHVRGAADDPLVIVYGDFTCPRCALAHQRLREQPLRVAFRHFALRARDPRAPVLAAAVEAAARQGAFWQLHDALMEDQGRVEDPHIWQHVRNLGLDLDRFQADRRDPALTARVSDDITGALRAGVSVAPTLFVQGKRHAGPPDGDLLARLRGAGQSPRRLSL
jgi:protein-disulfide isomerase